MGYKVPFIDVPKHYSQYREIILSTIDRVLRRGNLILRNELSDFEAKFATLIGSQYAVGVGSGTDALHLALRAIGFSVGDEIVTVSHTCIATVAAIVNAGATPVLVDVGPDYNIDPDRIEEAITPRTRAIVPVHLNGRACNMQRLMEIARRYNLIVVEDAAQGLGARFDGSPVGSFGLAGCFSLYPFKMLGALGDGGIVVTNDAQIAQRLRQLRDLGEDRITGELLHFGFNSRLDNLQAALVDWKLAYLPGWIQRRRQVAQMYKAGFAGIPGLQLPHFPDERYFDVFLNYCITSSQRDELVTFLRSEGVEALTPISIVKPIHRHPALGLERFNLPNTERIAREFIYLPTTPELDDIQIDHVVDVVRRFAKTHQAQQIAVQQA